MISLGSKQRKQRPLNLGVLAEYRTAEALLKAARRMRNTGYTKVEAFSPFPIHGMDDALRIRGSILPWLVLVAGIIGCVSALAFQWWTNSVAYRFVVSGKPLFSLPANIPVTFEVTILLAAFAAFFGMLMLNGLPRLHNPLLHNSRFRRVTNDGFFLFVDSRDANFSDDTAAELGDRTGALHTESISSEASNDTIPRGLVLTAAVVASLALLPPLLIAKARTTKSGKPRFHNFFDMDFQPKFKSQTTSSLFADGRAMRPRVTGTIPRGTLVTDPRVTYGLELAPQDAATHDSGIGTTGSPTGITAESREKGNQDTTLVSSSNPTRPNYVERIPLDVTDKLMRHGRVQFNIHCSVCHGKAGYGNGLVSQRALELEQGTWVPPTNLHSEYLFDQPDGQIFNTITNGVRKMPAHGHQIPPEDRWAIVAYVRALQRSQNTTLDDVPENYRQTLREFN